MLTVHHLNNSRSQRVLWLLEELELPYAIKHYQRDAKTMLAPPALKAVHPLGKSPLLEDDGVVYAESGAIIEYLGERYGAGRFTPAPGSEAARRTRFYLHYAEGSLMPLMLLTLVFTRMPKGPMPFFMRPPARLLAAGALRTFVGPQLSLHLGFLEGELAARTWLTGDELTLADFQMSFVLEAASARGGLDARYPKLAAYVARMRERPAYQRALAKGGPFVLG
jgi:glutathione S-transferase